MHIHSTHLIGGNKTTSAFDIAGGEYTNALVCCQHILMLHRSRNTQVGQQRHTNQTVPRAKRHG